MESTIFRRMLRGNQPWLWCALGLILVVWLVFKFLYPYPDLVFDSYHYIAAAYRHQTINAWPIGYSKFLELFVKLSTSANGFVSLQYIFQELALLWLFYSWMTIFRPGRLARWVILFLFFLNPLLLFCANFIMADSLFVTLSVLWVTQLVWLVYRPRPYMIISNAILLILTFSVRYNALYYPVISCLAFFLSRQLWWMRVVGILLPVVLVGLFVNYTQRQYAIEYGQSQFTPFGGWKIANDALFMYRHVYEDVGVPTPVELQSLDSSVRRYFETSRNREEVSDNERTSGSPFMFYNDSPLLGFMNQSHGRMDAPFNSTKWIMMGPLYQAYGTYLITRHPLSFVRYFVFPNIGRYFIPPGENYPFSDPFFLHEAPDNKKLREDFGFTIDGVARPLVGLRERLLLPYPLLFFVVHICFLAGLLGFWLMGGLGTLERPVLFCLVLITFLWLVDFVFSIFSAAVVLRYEIFVGLLEALMGGYFLEYMYRRYCAGTP